MLEDSRLLELRAEPDRAACLAPVIAPLAPRRAVHRIVLRVAAGPRR